LIKTARHLGLDDWEAIDHSDEAELAAFLQNCREWEGTPNRTVGSGRAAAHRRRTR